MPISFSEQRPVGVIMPIIDKLKNIYLFLESSGKIKIRV